MPIFDNICFEQIKDGYLQIVKYAGTYFPVHVTLPLKLWQNIFEIPATSIDNDDWKPALLIIELVMCAPQSNATLERFFSQLKNIKTNIRASLSSDSLNSLLRIKVTGPTLQKFHNEHVENVIELWYNSKDRRINNRKKRVKERCIKNVQVQKASANVLT